MKLIPHDKRLFLSMAIFQVSFLIIFAITTNEKLIETNSNKDQRMSVMLGIWYESKIKSFKKSNLSILQFLSWSVYN